MTFSHINQSSSSHAFTDLAAVERLKYGTDQDKNLRQVAEQFESLFINLMFKQMRSANAVFEKGNFLNSQESQYFRDMHDQQMSINLAQGGGIGIADILYRQLSRGQNLETDHDTLSAQLDHTPRRHAVSNVTGPAESEQALLFDSPKTFVKQLLPYAEKAAEKIGVDKTILIAQAALETGWGKHVLSDETGHSSNNLFNIKANGSWQGDTVKVASMEYLQNIFRPVVSAFKSYDSVQQSFDDYVALITQKTRYSDAIANAADSEIYVNSLQKAGYATDPQYAQKILDIHKRIDVIQNQRDGENL